MLFLKKFQGFVVRSQSVYNKKFHTIVEMHSKSNVTQHTNRTYKWKSYKSKIK